MKEKYCQKECPYHGITKFVLEGRGYYRCLHCRSESVIKHRIEKKQRLIEYFGGKCELCGYSKCNRALEFHHKDPKDKMFALSSRGLSYSLETCIEEAKKCSLLCANCHREVEDNIL